MFGPSLSPFSVHKHLQQTPSNRKAKPSRMRIADLSKLKSKVNPQPNSHSYLQPRKLHLRSMEHKNPKKYYSIDTDMTRILQNQPSSNRRGRSVQKLPFIGRSKVVYSHSQGKQQKSHKKSHYRNPTCTSQLHFQDKKHPLKHQTPRKICSVNCLHPQPEAYKPQKSSRQRQHSDHCSTILEQYLSNEAKSRYPTTQLQSYLQKMKQNRIKSPQHKPVDKQYFVPYSPQKETLSYEQEVLYYPTYFGLQPQFYTLQTEYVTSLYSPPPVISTLEHYKPNVLPPLPSKDQLAQYIQQYQSQSKEIDMEALMQQENFLVQYTQFQVYFGQMQGDQRSGKGVLIGQKYCFEGLFSDNQRIKGYEMTPSGYYRGDFYYNKKQGYGQFQWINGQYYIGQWKDGQRHGKGLWTNRRGDSYNGDWRKGRGQGYGIYITAGTEGTKQGRQYHGDFKDFKKDGWGREKLPNNDTYEGGFQNSLPQGKGIYTWSNGTKYEGQFSHGFRSGKGVLSTLDGFSYNGQFIDQKAQGLCQISMPNGDRYQGYLKNGKKNGRGILQINEERVLDGYWQNDRFLGKASE